MISFPNAKINLGLYVLNKRSDGYHNLETVFMPVPLYDILEIIKSEDPHQEMTENNIPRTINNRSVIHINKSLTVELMQSGLSVDGPPESNLCIKAIQKYNEYTPLSGRYFIHLHKRIPSGAGLGGGSADGSFTLNMINAIQGYSLEFKKLQMMAAQLGSDCPALLLNKPALGKGRGEIIKEINVSLEGYTLVIVKPPVHINTAEAFKYIEPDNSGSSSGLEEIMKLTVSNWKDMLSNDFEPSVFKLSDEISSIKSGLYDKGAVYASLTGSGSAVYGIFEKPLVELNFPETYFYFETVL